MLAISDLAQSHPLPTVSATELIHTLQRALAGYSVTFSIKDQRLHVLFEYADALAFDQGAALNIIVSKIKTRRVEDLAQLVVCGRVSGKPYPEWLRMFRLFSSAFAEDVTRPLKRVGLDCFARTLEHRFSPPAADPLPLSQSVEPDPTQPFWPRLLRWVSSLLKLQRSLPPVVGPAAPVDPLDLARDLFVSREYERAIDVCWAALAADPNLAEAHHIMGKSFFALGHLKAALSAYRTVLQICSPCWAQLRIDLGLALLQAGDIEAASAEFYAALAMDPSSAMACYGLGKAELARGHYEAAWRQLEAALEADPQLWSASVSLGLLLLAQKQRDAEGRKFIDVQKARAARERFEQALRQDPNLAEAHFGMGEIYRIMGDLPQALQSYGKALRLNNSLTAAHYRVGTIYARQKRFELAIESLQSALDLNPQHPEVREILDRVIVKQNSLAPLTQIFHP